MQALTQKNMYMFIISIWVFYDKDFLGFIFCFAKMFIKFAHTTNKASLDADFRKSTNIALKSN